MKLQDVVIDSILVEQGEWVENIADMGDLRLKVRGLGNADWRRLSAKLSAAVPRDKKRGGVVDSDEQDKIIATCLRDTCLLDWANLTDQDDKPIPYSKAKAGELLNDPDMRRFAAATLWAASMVGDGKQAVNADALGN